MLGGANWWPAYKWVRVQYTQQSDTRLTPLSFSVRRRRAADLTPSPIAWIVSCVPPQTKNVQQGRVKKKHTILLWVDKMHMCTYLHIYYTIGLLTHVPFPGFWWASLFSIFRHCDRQTFLRQTCLLFIYLRTRPFVQIWDSTDWDCECNQCDSLRFCWRLSFTCTARKWKCNDGCLLLYFRFRFCVVALLYSHSRSSF